jgi:two-component system OmpR family sensor kinase
VLLLSSWFTSLRRRLVVWYLSVLAVLLAGLCVFQTVILTRYVHSARAAALGHPSATGYALVLQARLTLVFGALAVFLVTAAVALPIINRALGPLQHVARTAEAIAAGDLTKRANLAPSVDEVGRLGEAFDIMVDRLQDALAASNASEERMRQFLADASHELRTPLTVLRGTAQVLLREKNLDPEEFDAAMAGIRDESIRLSRLVDDLLTLSKLDAGQPLEPHPVPISPFLAEFVERYASAWPARVIVVEADQLHGTQAHVDPEALRRMLTNLVDNAARYSAPGGPIVIAGISAPESVSIVVRDEGPGLSPEDAARVFERFYRGNKSRSRLSGGTGLGLAIVHALVEQSQGEIRIDTGPDRGTTVAIELPRLTATAQLAAG